MGPQGAAVRRRGPETGVDVILHHGHRIQRFAEARRFAALYAGILRAVVPAGRRFGRSEPPGRFTTRHKEGARGWSSESRTALSPTAQNVRRSRKSVQPSLTASNNTPTSRTRPAAFDETMRSPGTRWPYRTSRSRCSARFPVHNEAPQTWSKFWGATYNGPSPKRPFCFGATPITAGVAPSLSGRGILDLHLY